jgi:hypothetical protein
MLAGLRLPHTQLGVLAVPPTDRQDDLTRRLVDVGDDIISVMRARVSRWRVRIVTLGAFHAALFPIK